MHRSNTNMSGDFDVSDNQSLISHWRKRYYGSWTGILSRSDSRS